MSKVIAQLLNEPERLVSRALAKVETKNSYPDHDVRLIAENIQKIRAKITELGMDPDDTTGPELYHALIAKFQKDSLALEESLNMRAAGFNLKSVKAAALIKAVVELPDQWALKTTPTKNSLRAQPPKQLMKHLNYRSVESLLKRENLAEVVLAAAYTESAGWRKNWARQVSQQDSTAFELRPLNLASLIYERWADIPGPAEYVVQDNDIAALSLWPSPPAAKMPLLTMILLLLDKLNDYQSVKICVAAAGLSPAIAWWAGLDHLLADLDGETVSFNIKDVALNSLHQHTYEDRQVHTGRRSFWQELLSRYEYLEPAELLPSELNRLKTPTRQPAFELVEGM